MLILINPKAYFEKSRNGKILTVFEFYIFRGEYVALNIFAGDPLLGEIDGN